jgi:hypothetical protein
MGGNLYTSSFNSVSMLTIKNKYIRFIANGFLFIALIFIFDQVLGKVLRHFYFKSEYGITYQLTYSLDSTKADVIILGSSRANHNYIPQIIEDSLNLSCFNTGMDGNFMLNSSAFFKSIVKRHTPKIVLMDISLDELFIGTWGYDELTYLLPYYRNKPEIRDVVLLKSKFEKIKLISEVYPYNSTPLSILEGNIRTEDISKFKGYSPIYGKLKDTTIKSEQERDLEVDTNKIKALDAIASDCETQNIKLIFIQSPRYSIINQKTSVSILNEIATNHDAEFWNYLNDTMFKKPEYFEDESHMNDLGAQLFTKTIANRLKK